MTDIDVTSGSGGVVLYDGDCGLCDRWVGFVVARDGLGLFRYAPLQGPLGMAVLGGRRDSAEPDLDSVLVVLEPGTSRERLLVRSRAVLHVLSRLSPLWKVVAQVLSVVPVPVADSVYRWVAARRKRWFSAPASCRLPDPSIRVRFRDMD